jgi:protein subunit release factor A
MIIEVRAGEGGADACLFVHELANAYVRHLDSIG